MDFKIFACGGNTNTLLLKELPSKKSVPLDERISELREEIQCLRSELSYYRTLADVLLRILPMIDLQSGQLQVAIQKVQADVERISGDKKRASGA